MTRAGRAYLIIATLAVLLCGCVSEGGDINDNPNAGNPQDQYNTLRQRPNIEEATHKYKKLLEEMRVALADEFGISEWEYTNENKLDESGCGFDFPDMKADQGVARSIKGGFARAAIPAGKWDQALEVVTKIARKYGFKGPQRIADKPGNREVYYFDYAGTRFAFGQVNNISIGVSTGCFLTPEAHRRGAPLPSSER